MPDYYDPDGKPIDMWTWAAMFDDRSDQPHYRTTVRGGVPWREQEVSTVWLGLDHSFGGPVQLTWETLVFPECTFMLRYPSHELAWVGHQLTVAIIRARCEGHRWNAGQMRPDRRVRREKEPYDPGPGPEWERGPNMKDVG